MCGRADGGCSRKPFLSPATPFRCPGGWGPTCPLQVKSRPVFTTLGSLLTSPPPTMARRRANGRKPSATVPPEDCLRLPEGCGAPQQCGCVGHHGLFLTVGRDGAMLAGTRLTRVAPAGQPRGQTFSHRAFNLKSHPRPGISGLPPLGSPGCPAGPEKRKDLCPVKERGPWDLAQQWEFQRTPCSLGVGGGSGPATSKGPPLMDPQLQGRLSVTRDTQPCPSPSSPGRDQRWFLPVLLAPALGTGHTLSSARPRAARTSLAPGSHSSSQTAP